MRVLSTENLSIGPGGHKLVVDLNWQVNQGELWCILGQNGAGKTSLLHALSGHSSRLSGEILIDGMSLDAMPADVLAMQRGFMPQQQVDTLSSTVMATVLIGRIPHCIGSSCDTAEDHAAAAAALAAVGLSHKAQMDVLTLSAGERQRVALAALLLQAPQLMLLDEPAAHQDVAQQLVIMRLIRNLPGRHAVITSCHDIDLAARFATHVLVLAEGRHWLGPAEEVLTVAILEAAFGCHFDMKESNGVRSFLPY